MATLAEIEAAIAKADKAGRTDLADHLRAYAAKMQSERVNAAIAKAEAAGRQDLADQLRAASHPKPAAPAPVVQTIVDQPQPTTAPITPAPAVIEGPVEGRILSPEEQRQSDLSNFAQFEAANPTLAGQYTPETMPRAGDLVVMGGGGRGGGGRYTVQPWTANDIRQQGSFGETAASMMEGPVAAAKAFGGGLTGGPSPSRDFLAQDPLTRGLPSPVLTGLGAIGDIGGAALSTVGAGLSGAVGLATEAVPFQDAASREKLGNELLGMSMFAVPELAGASSIPARLAGAAPAIAPIARPAMTAEEMVARTFTVRPPRPPIQRAAPIVSPKTVAAIPETVVAQAAAKTPEEVASLARKAASGGMGSVKAQEALAVEARINPEAKAAADRLGIDLPADVFSESENVRAIAGLARSEVGKEPEALWRSAVKLARDKADEIMAAMDGAPDIATVSENVKSSLQATQSKLKTTAKGLYEEVDAAVPKSTEANVTNIVKALNGVIEDLGGPEGMSSAERTLYALVTSSQPVTYGRLMREKNLIGKAIARGDSPYSSMDSATLARMYGAIAEDQMATVGNIGDEALRLKLREANQLTAKQKALEKRIVASFGSDLDGSIGAKLKTAIKQGSQGDIAALTRILKVIPEDLRKSAVASAISAATRSARATEPGFGLSEFAKAFSGIQTNKPVYNLIGKTLGPEAMGVLKDLNTVAKRIAVADSNVLRTGKANQAIVGALMADGLVGRVLNSTGGQRVAQSAAIGAGTAMGGPVGGMVAGPIASALMTAKPDVLAKVGKLFSSDDFQNLIVTIAEGKPAQQAVDAVKKSSAFMDWAKSLRVKDFDAVLSGVAPAGQAANANAGPDYESLWGRY